jgi:hypothetical protein
MTETRLTKINSIESSDNKDQRREVDPYQGYCIVIAGELDPSWSEWLGGLQITVSHDQEGNCLTILCGEIPDQPALRSILNKIWDLHLTLYSVNQVHVRSQENLKEVNHE